MKSLLFALVLCLSSLALPLSAAEDLPLHFDKFAKNRYLLVMLSSSLACWQQCLAQQNTWASPRWN